MSIKVVTEIKTFVVCPHCHQPAGTIDHLIQECIKDPQIPFREKSFGSWNCTNCNKGYTGIIKPTKEEPGYMVEITKSKEFQIPLWILLCHNETDDPKNNLFLLVDDFAYMKEGEELDLSGKVYYYNSHTCPSNYLRSNVISRNDTDPHGIFCFVAATVALTKDQLLEKFPHYDRTRVKKMYARTHDLVDAAPHAEEIFRLFNITDTNQIYECPTTASEIETELRKTSTSLTYTPGNIELDISESTPLQLDGPNNVLDSSKQSL